MQNVLFYVIIFVYSCCCNALTAVLLKLFAFLFIFFSLLLEESIYSNPQSFPLISVMLFQPVLCLLRLSICRVNYSTEQSRDEPFQRERSIFTAINECGEADSGCLVDDEFSNPHLRMSTIELLSHLGIFHSIFHWSRKARLSARNLYLRRGECHWWPAPLSVVNQTKRKCLSMCSIHLSGGKHLDAAH